VYSSSFHFSSSNKKCPEKETLIIQQQISIMSRSFLIKQIILNYSESPSCHSSSNFKLKLCVWRNLKQEKSQKLIFHIITIISEDFTLHSPLCVGAENFQISVKNFSIFRKENSFEAHKFVLSLMPFSESSCIFAGRLMA
jgi:hypothetical protein